VLAPTNKPNWRRWFEAFGTETLPIIPVGATLKPGSKVRQAQVGKVPGTKNADGTWSGLGGSWSDEHFTTMVEAKGYDKDGAAIAVQSRELLGLDIDVDDAAIAAAIQSLAEDYLGLAPVRTRPGSARRLMMYRVDGAPLRKVRQEFGTKQAVELLARGQQYVVEGSHPAGGEYAWLGEHPCDLGRDNLPKIDADLIARFFEALRSMLSGRGLALGRAPTDAAASTTTRKSLDDPSLWAPSPEAVLELLAAWTPDELAHDDFVAAMAAIKASLGPRREEFYGEVLEWAPGVRSTEDDATRKVWESISDAQVGWGYLVAVSGDLSQAQADFDDEVGEANFAAAPAPLASEADGLSHDALAIRFADLHIGDMRFAATMGRWFVWDTNRWCHDEKLHAMTLARQVCRQATRRSA
jgi:Bifunctional DNA primase/polymerase, N-terminal